MGCISFVTQMNRLDVFNTKTASGVTCGVYESTSYMWVVKLLSSSQTDTKHTVSIKNDEFFPSGLTTCWKEVPTPPLSFFPSVPPGPPGDLCRFHMLNFALTGVLTRLLKITVWSNSFECLWYGLGWGGAHFIDQHSVLHQFVVNRNDLHQSFIARTLKTSWATQERAAVKIFTTVEGWSWD